MLPLIKLLEKESKEASIIDYDRMLFTYNDFLILLDFDTHDAELDLGDWYLDSDIRDVSELEDDFLKRLFVKEVSITDYEYLGDREILTLSDNIKSITNKLYRTLNFISSIDTEAVEKYDLNLNDGYNDSGGWCPGEPNFIFNIYIKERYFSNLVFFETILQNQLIEVECPPLFYSPFYKAYKKVEDSGKLNILNTNTKARRLGYLKLLGKMFYTTSKISSIKLNSKFENYAIKYTQSLESYKNSKGVIQKTKTGNSAQPYITLANEIGLIININAISMPSKLMKVYLQLRHEITEPENPFILDKFDKLFFLENILANDFFYISAILELLYTKTVSNYSGLLKEFQPFLLFRLTEFIDEYKEDRNNIKKVKQFRIIEERIRKWTEPEVYLEHVIMPRINWLVDLDLVNSNIDQEFSLQMEGKKLFENFGYWNDINYQRINNPQEFIKLFSVNLYDSVYNNNYTTILKESTSIRQQINDYIDESFLYFRTLAPNRVTASQSIAFAKYKLYLYDNIKVSERYIENYLKNEASDIYIYKYQKQYQDGYIQKIKKL